MQHTGAESGAGRPQRLLLLALVLAALLAVPAAGLTLTVQDRSVAPNGTVVVPIVVADAQDIGGVNIVLVYDPAVLQFESAAPSGLADRAQVSSNEGGPGRVTIAVASPRSVTGTGPFVALTFAAVGPAGARSAVALEAVRAVTVDDEPVPAQVVNGTVSVEGGARTPLSPFAAVGALAVVGASLSKTYRGRYRRYRRERD